MLGPGRKDPGVIPRLCCALFDRITAEQLSSGSISDGKRDPGAYKVTVSYYEIYNEKVRDLIDLSKPPNLKVREHPLRGPYVENLATVAVADFEELAKVLVEGNRARTVGATAMNQSSSRSHAVFVVNLLKQKRTDPNSISNSKKSNNNDKNNNNNNSNNNDNINNSGKVSASGSPLSNRRRSILPTEEEKVVSRIHLVDLAGSERSMGTRDKTQAREGVEINKSLTTLGRVISTLVEKERQQQKARGRRTSMPPAVVPYRDSTLTWLLKDALGGNSLTTLIATVSPSAEQAEQTQSTLRFADGVKRIKNQAVVNENSTTRLVRELKEEVATLRAELAQRGPTTGPSTPTASTTSISENNNIKNKSDKKSAELTDQLAANERLLAEVNQTWEQKLRETEQIQRRTALALRGLGIALDSATGSVTDGDAGQQTPFLVNLSDDPMLTECLVYNINTGNEGDDGKGSDTIVGNMENISADIKLDGPLIRFEHCKFRTDASTQQIAIVVPESDGDSTVMLNGEAVKPGSSHELHTGDRLILGNSHVFRFTNPKETIPQAPKSAATFDWSYALHEVVGNEGGLESLDDEDLQLLYAKVIQAKDRRRESSRSRPQSATPTRRNRLSMGGLSEMSLEGSRASTPLGHRRRRSSIFSTPTRPPLWMGSEYSLSLSPPPQLESPSMMAYFNQTQERLIRKYSDIWRSHTLVADITTVLTRGLALIHRAQAYSDYFDLKLVFELVVADDLIYSPYESTISANSVPVYDTQKHTFGALSVRVMDYDEEIVHLVAPTALERALPLALAGLDQLALQAQADIRAVLPFLRSKHTVLGVARGVAAQFVTSAPRDVFEAELISPYTHSIVGLARVTLRKVTTAPQSALKLHAIPVNVTVATLAVSGFSHSEVMDIHTVLLIDSEPVLVTPVQEVTTGVAVKFDSYFTWKPEWNAPGTSIKLIVYGSVRKPFLDRLHSWDEMQEPGLPKTETPTEGEDQNYTAVVSRILELDENAAYQPVNVIEEQNQSLPYYFLHQGLQRRIEITVLTHTTDETFWKSQLDTLSFSISKFQLVEISTGRLISIDSNAPIALRPIGAITPISNTADEIQGFRAVCQWPASSLLLDKITPESSRLIFLLSINLPEKLGPSSCPPPYGSGTLNVRLSARANLRLVSGVSRWGVIFGHIGIQDCAVNWYKLRPGYHKVPQVARDFRGLVSSGISAGGNGCPVGGGTGSAGNEEVDNTGSLLLKRGVSLIVEYYTYKEKQERATKIEIVKHELLSSQSTTTITNQSNDATQDEVQQDIEGQGEPLHQKLQQELQICGDETVQNDMYMSNEEFEEEELAERFLELWQMRSPSKLDIVSIKGFEG